MLQKRQNTVRDGMEDSGRRWKGHYGQQLVYNRPVYMSRRSRWGNQCMVKWFGFDPQDGIFKPAKKFPTYFITHCLQKNDERDASEIFEIGVFEKAGTDNR